MYASEKAMNFANTPEFQSRVRFALVQIASGEVDGENSARVNYAKSVINGNVNLHSAAVLVVANAAIAASIDGAEEGSESEAVLDSDIAFAIAEGSNPAVGVFNKLAIASQ